MHRLAPQMRIMAIACATAVLLALGYAFLVSPAFEPYFDDQVAYLRLAHGFIERGEYTRAAIGAAFVPEPLWPPGYPLFLAPLCLFGCSHWMIAITQALLYGGLVLLAGEVARPIIGAPGSRIAALVVGLYLPIAYWSTLAYSDFLAAFLLTASLAAFLRARRHDSVGWGIASGALLGWLALTRPIYVLFPAALLLLGLVVDGRRLLERRRLVPLVALAGAFLIVISPLFVYSQRYFGQPFASSSGAVLWLGAVQGVDGSHLDAFEAEEVDVVRTEVASFDRITDRLDQAYAWVTLDASLGQHAVRFIEHDVAGYLARAPVRAIALWASDIPVPVDLSRSLDPSARVAIGALELAMMLFALAWAVIAVRRRDDAALLPIVVILYVTVLFLPVGTQARYSLAAKPLVLTSAIGAIAMLRDRRRAGSVHP